MRGYPRTVWLLLCWYGLTLCVRWLGIFGLSLTVILGIVVLHEWALRHLAVETLGLIWGAAAILSLLWLWSDRRAA